ncbi:hypothetical protein MJG53_010061, partial [Ovis ammon polii x Ovis aries]
TPHAFEGNKIAKVMLSVSLASVPVGTDPKTLPLRQIPASHIPFVSQEETVRKAYTDELLPKGYRRLHVCHAARDNPRAACEHLLQIKALPEEKERAGRAKGRERRGPQDIGFCDWSLRKPQRRARGKISEKVQWKSFSERLLSLRDMTVELRNLTQNQLALVSLLYWASKLILHNTVHTSSGTFQNISLNPTDGINESKTYLPITYIANTS